MTRFLRHRPAAVGLACLVLVAGATALAPWLPVADPLRQSIKDRLQTPSAAHWLGTDQFGRDLLARIVHGGRISLGVATLSLVIGLLAGGTLGLTAGYFARVDDVLMRVMDVLLAFPAILLAILIVAMMRPGLVTVIVAVGVRSIPLYARMVRGAVLVVRHMPYAEAAAALGASHLRTIARTILPNSFAPILVFSTLQVANNILLAAILSYLGLGVQPPAAEWGIMVSQGRGWLRDAPHVAIVPGLAIFVVVLATNLVGDALRDTLDVRLRESTR